MHGFRNSVRGNAEQAAIRAGLTPSVRDRRLRTALSKIEAEPSCSAKELACQVGLSPAHLQRLFKQETGCNISDLLVENRLQRAAQLLSTSDLPIRTVAYAVGYRQHSSFIRAFCRRFAQTPKLFRSAMNPARLANPAV